MDGVVWGPDDHTGRGRRDAFDRPGGRSGRAIRAAKEGARLRPTTHLSHARPNRPDRRARFKTGNRGQHLRKERSEEHTSELQSRQYLVCRLLLEKKKQID